MSDLIAFLLARIADDQERAEFVQRENAGGYGPVEYEQWRLSWHDEYDLLCIEPERALAEVAAKRLMIEAFPDAGPDGDGWNEAGMRALELIAMPYSAHPDYRKEWLQSWEAAILIDTPKEQS